MKASQRSGDKDAQVWSKLDPPEISAIYEMEKRERSICIEHVEGKPTKQLLFVTETFRTSPRCL